MPHIPILLAILSAFLPPALAGQDGPSSNERGRGGPGGSPRVRLVKDGGSAADGTADPATVRPAEDRSAELNARPGFKVERIYEVPKDEGSWVSMTVRDDGRLLCCDQYGGLYEVTPGAAGEGVRKVERLDLAIGGAHGLLWFQGALWVAVNERVGGDSGVYRLTDHDGDGRLDDIKLIRQVRGSGEHGVHALVPSPDGAWIYFLAGNQSQVPGEIARSRVPKAWGEDHLLERMPDARGHARGRMAPGGFVCRFRPDGSEWELVSIGYRNPYDMAFDERGELFVYDADMEWDLGTPWYRPTRLCHAVSGSDFGWRNGTGKWPSYYEDSWPSVIDIGPGSPTGVVSGRGARFPARYQRALFLLDWTFGTLYAVHLEPRGASFTAGKEEILAGKGMPFTDAAIGRDGALYFATGGRRAASALWRLSYVGDEPTAPVEARTAAPNEASLRRLALEKLHGPGAGDGIETIEAGLASDDHFVRAAARVALEHLPVAAWRERLRAERNPWRVISQVIALARHGEPADQAAALGALGALDWDGLSKEQKLGLLRAYALVFVRLGKPGEEAREAALKHLDARYPAGDDELDRELCRVLSFLPSPTVVAKTLKLMAALKEPRRPDWARLASRNQGYGQAVLNMLANLPSEQDLHYAYCIRSVPGPWTPGQRRQYFTWFGEAARRSGGASYGGFIKNLVTDALRYCTPEERELVEDLKPPEPPSALANLPPVKGPGQNWSAEQVVALVGEGLVGADLANGKRMFRAALCAACHQFKGEGGSAGPDLTGVGGRFQPGDLAEAVLNPSSTVSDQYRFDVITLTDESSLTGRILDEKDGKLVVATSPFDFDNTVAIPRAEVSSIEPSAVSPMPPGLVFRLNRDELRDLLAYLLKP